MSRSYQFAENIVAVPVDLYHKMSGKIPSAFRFTDDSQYALVIQDPKKPLTNDAICKINLTCDQHEGAKNKDIKAILSGSLSRHFAERSYQLIEFGPGVHPLTKTRPLENADIDYHGIDIDPHVITELKARGTSASTINDIPEGTLRMDRPRAAAGVYTLHFWNPDTAPDDVKHVISKDGFFVANYMTSKKATDPQHSKALLKAFNDEGLNVSIIRQSSAKAAKGYSDLGNEFWVISHPSRGGFRSACEKFAETLNTYLDRALPNDGWMKQAKSLVKPQPL